LGRRPRGRGKQRAPGRGHDDPDRPALSAWVSRPGSVVVQGVQDGTVTTGQKAAAGAGPAGRRRSPESAGSSQALQGSGQAFVHHTQKA